MGSQLANPSPSNKYPAYTPAGAEDPDGFDEPAVTARSDGSKVKAALAGGTRARPRGFKPNPPQTTRK